MEVDVAPRKAIKPTAMEQLFISMYSAETSKMENESVEVMDKPRWKYLCMVKSGLSAFTVTLCSGGKKTAYNLLC